MTPKGRRLLFAAGMAVFIALYVWATTGLPGFGRYPGPYGYLVNARAIAQTNATGVVSAVNFDYRGFDTVGEEFILFIAVVGVATVLRRLRREHPASAADSSEGRDRPGTSEGVSVPAILLAGPTFLFGWFLATHAQTNPSGGFQGGVILATAFILVYLAGKRLAFRSISPVDLNDAIEALGAGSFVAIGIGAMAVGFPYLTDVLPLGTFPGEVDSSGTIALISFFVGLEVTAAFVLVVSELLEQTLLVRGGRS